MYYPSKMRYSSSSGGPNNNLVLVGERNNNRLRLDTGASGSSEESKGGGKPPRRRSHRPRGCRGGSNRRRNNNADNVTRASTKGNEQKTKQENKTFISKYTNQKQGFPSMCGPTMQEFTILNRQSQFDQTISMDYQNNLCQREHSTSSSMSVSKAPFTDYSSTHESFDHFFLPNEFTSIQSSFSDSSSDFGIDPASQATMMLQSDSDNSSVGSGSNSIGNRILPPLPSNVVQYEYIPSGPNPYALKSSSIQGNADKSVMYSCENLTPFQEPSHSSYTKMMGGYATPMKELVHTTYNHNYPLQQSHSNYESGYNNQKDTNAHSHLMGPPLPRPRVAVEVSASASANSKYGASIIPSLSSSNENEYRSVRLEIQRQNVEGGSLFLTSPRSFLMGKRNCFSVAGSAAF